MQMQNAGALAAEARRSAARGRGRQRMAAAIFPARAAPRWAARFPRGAPPAGPLAAWAGKSRARLSPARSSRYNDALVANLRSNRTLAALTPSARGENSELGRRSWPGARRGRYRELVRSRGRDAASPAGAGAGGRAAAGPAGRRAPPRAQPARGRARAPHHQARRWVHGNPCQPIKTKLYINK